MKTAKWFYPAQEEVENKLDQFYKKERQCVFQHVTKDRVTEFYHVIEASGKQTSCTVCILKNGKSFRVLIYASEFIASIN